MTYSYPVAFSCWSEEERAAISRVVASGRFTQGPEVEAFENEFATYHGMKHGIFINSGSSANLIAIASLFHKQYDPLVAGDVAVVPAIAWATTYAPLVQHGLDLRIGDVGNDWNMEAEHLRRDVPLCVSVPVLGAPVAAHYNGARYRIEDCCESVGAQWKGIKAGTTGILNTFSFFYSHQLSAIEGGMILTDDDELDQLCRMLRDHGATRSVMKAARFEDEYDFRLFGYNVRGLEIHAAIARAQLKKIGEMRAWRNRNHEVFAEMVKKLNVTLPKMNGIPNPFGMSFITNGFSRTELVRRLRAAGVDCRLPTGGSFLRHRYSARWRSQRTPKADVIHERGLFLGNAGYDITPLIEKAVKVMKDCL